jgi:2,4-dienoyl-CoA reductase-like NADH-dependent reductase (Old Yellow Enzyme family)
MSGQPLFTAFTLGVRRLRNRIVMAPMTRARAKNAGHVPTGRAAGLSFIRDTLRPENSEGAQGE